DLKCPHCHTPVSHGASVCCGCGAEVVRGASRQEQAIAGWILAVCGSVALLLAMGKPPPSASYQTIGFFIILGILGAFVAFNIIGRLIAKFLLRSKVRFFRSYRHQ
ncbi:MAG: hypothetical protein WBV90_20190, partial [Terrimicrobiaceae bacterium]